MPKWHKNMQQETKKCQNCKQDFIIEPDDFAFYEKMKVPPPTFCPECSLRFRLAVRNDRTLYKRKCNAPGHSEDIIATHYADAPFTVYDEKYWWSDAWDPLDYGKEYNFNKNFFVQFRELLESVPVANLSTKGCTDCQYCNVMVDAKNCYFSFGSGFNEDVMYSYILNTSRNCLDCSMSMKLESSYESVDSDHSSGLHFCQNAVDCINSAFLFNCRNCSDCFACINLRNKSYCIFNQQHSKDDYKKKLLELDLGSFTSLEKIKKEVQDFYLKNIFISNIAVRSVNVSGHNIFNSKNCQNCFDIFEGVEDGKNLFIFRNHSKDIRNSNSGGWNSELIYEGISIIRSARVKFSAFCWDNREIEYCDTCHNCAHLFGCTGLRNKQYCILNKQYTKEEYEKLVPKIIAHMNSMPYTDKKGRVYKYGDFFPIELSPFSYNESSVQQFFPLTKNEIIDKGYNWKEPEERHYNISLLPENLPDRITETKEDVLKEVIGCAHEGKCSEQCTGAFKIIPEELRFYRQHNLPLPRFCPNCRYYQRMQKRNPLKLWHRQCMCNKQHSHHGGRCPNEFETSYAPDRPEIVYCEQCYQQEVA